MKPVGYVTIKREQEEAVKKIEIDRARWGSEGMLSLVEKLIRLAESPHIEESLLLSIERMAWNK